MRFIKTAQTILSVTFAVSVKRAKIVKVMAAKRNLSREQEKNIC